LGRHREALAPQITTEQLTEIAGNKVILGRLKATAIEAWFQRHQASGASASRVRYAVLGVALNQARKWELLSVNATALVEPPRHVTKQTEPLTPLQARALLDTARSHRLAALISVPRLSG
jgi:hypothetical protein